LADSKYIENTPYDWFLSKPVKLSLLKSIWCWKIYEISNWYYAGLYL